jgi:putative transposase
MAKLIFNEVLRIDSPSLQGLYRVIAPSPCGDMIRLGFISALDDVSPGQNVSQAVGAIESVARSLLQDSLVSHELKSIELRPPAWMLAPEDQMPDETKAQWSWRRNACTHMLDPSKLMATVGASGEKASLIRLTIDDDLCSRPEAYKLWKVLVRHGFSVVSLMPKYAFCGGPGVPRPLNENRKKAGAKKKGYATPEDVPHPQRGLVEEDHKIILHHYRRLQQAGLSATTLYDKIIEVGYVTEYVEEDGKRLPVLPPQGTFPNHRQVRHVIESRVSDFERVLRKTSAGHFQRNLRGMRGRSYSGVAGPGHTYAIDSTIADIYLRSAVNPAWIIGRPIIYVVVDVYSTAIVGFYVCLEGPAWRDAKLALYCSLCESDELASLIGVEPIQSLWPTPTLPFKLRGDRGEYLSLGARQTGLDLSLSYEFAPPRRPDWKGVVEVLHRISKDQQFTFLPGAFDARRRELELRQSKPQESALNLREYAQYLYGRFEHYNLFADRSSRMSAEMIAAGIEPTPAGLWRFGHEAGFGFQRAVPEDLLVKHLLRQGSATVRRDGIFFESQEYAPSSLERLQEWTRQARRSGAIDLPVHFHPYSLGKIRWVDPTDGMCALTMRGNARATPDLTLYDWRDALMADRRKNDDRAYARLQAALALAAEQRQMVKVAIERTSDAEAGTPLTSRPNVREARAIELIGAPDVPAQRDPTPSGAPDGAGDDYLTLIDEVFDEMNRAHDV